MFKKSILLATSILLALTGTTQAQDRYQNRPPVIISPDLTAPWVMQLGGAVEPVVYRQQVPRATRKQLVRQRILRQRSGVTLVQPASVVRAERPASKPFDPQYLPQTVAYDTKERPGTIVIDTNNRFLYLVTGNGEARRYGVGVGKPGFEWAGAHKITRKAEWPTWTPPSEMRAREAAKGHFLPRQHDRRPGKSARGPRHVSRQHALSHPRNQCAVDHRLRCFFRLHPHAQRRCRRPL